MSLTLKHTFSAAFIAATAWSAADPAYAAVGDTVTNIASVTFTSGGVDGQISTNPAIFTIEMPDVSPTIEFFRHSPNGPNSVIVNVNGSDYSPTGQLSGPFSAVGPARTTGGRIVDTSVPLQLTPAEIYLTGELMFVTVTDTSANESATEIDTITISVNSDNGDTIVLQLYESGPNTGQFWAYIPTTGAKTALNDNELTTGNNTRMTATYVNTFTQSEVVVDTALINPSNFVFDSVTGAPVDGAIVTVINADTNQPALVFGVDGVSSFPTSVTSGMGADDEAGLNYDAEAGEFSFPMLPPGNYRLDVQAPEGYSYSSAFSPSEIVTNGGAYTLLAGSFGEVFTLTEETTFRFDIPLDPQTDFVLTKVADRTFGDVGDFIQYTVNVQNTGSRSAPVRLFDTLPLGFRYLNGTSRQNNLAIADPAVSDNATLLTFPMGVLAPGESIRLDYALQIGPGAPMGDAINRAVVRGADDAQLSNIARAEVTLREDLLRSTSTVIGRVSEKSCDKDEDWARDIVRGIGVEGVRLYLETGAYAVSDADGLFHFEGVSEGTHVVQVDEETLPQGFSPMICEENTRYAGSATSKFIDVQGGGVWRANFYLEQTGETAAQTVSEEVAQNQAYKKFDQAWLNDQSSTPELVYPNTKDTPATPSVNIGIKHRPDQRVEIVLNDRPLSALNLSGRDTSASQLVMISRWRGVDLLEGDNRLVAIVRNSDGSVATTLTETISYVKTIARATPLPSQSVLVADGRTVPSLAIRLEDEAGRPVHKGRIVSIDVEQPYRIYDATGERAIAERQDEMINPLAARQDITVGLDGILRLRLEPTLQTGKITAIVTLDNGRKVPIYMYLEPEKRDWILVGLAEGSAAWEKVKGNSIAIGGEEKDDIITDGRVAFFAKGLIKGDWLATVAVDTDGKRGDRDDDFAGEIDPNAYYTLYGDRSYQEFEGVSRYPVYIKLEKRTAYAMFGDYDTNIPEGRLTAYNRRLSGLKAEYVGENFQVVGFAAETNQGFAKDELPADGTSGTYQLSNRRILAQSERIVIETRDRNRPDIILERKVLVRFLDYTLDYLTGQLIFRQPVDVSDFDFNPNVIVADYETSEDAERNLTFGGRVQAEFMDDRLRIGSTFVKEDGSALASGAKSNMVGIDVVGQLSETTEVRAEYALSDTTPGIDGAQAILAEVIHTSEKLQAEAYFRQEDAGFGLGQRNSNTNARRRYGVDAAYEINEFEDEETGRRGRNTIQGLAYREENLETGDTRDSAEVTAKHQGDRMSYSAGLRGAKDNLVGRENRESLLAVARASFEVPKHDVTFQIAHEQPLGGKDTVSAFPQRTTLGVDKRIGKKATASIRHEILDGGDNRSGNTTVGLTTTPWTGAAISASSDLLTNDLGRRLGATVGLDQQVQISEKWSASAGVRNRQVLEQSGEYIEVAPDAAISPLEVNEDFTSAYVGVGYRDEVMTGSTRFEARNSSEGDTWIGTGALARELSEELSIAGAMRGVFNEASGEPNATSQLDARVGAAWRPRGEETVYFNRLDLRHAKNVRGETETKFVNNLAMNTMVADNWQLSTNYGVKHVRTDIANQKFKSWSHLVGAETRFDLTEKIDLGLRGQLMTTSGTGTKEFSYGPSIGIAPVKNVWINAGYNVVGFKDDDFEAAEYSRKGVYLQMRIKFDQHTAEGLLRRISPSNLVADNGTQTRSFANP